MTHRRRSLLIPLVSLVGVAWFALWACAPMSTMPVPGAIGEQENEFAIAGNYTAGSEAYLGEFLGTGVGASGQLSYQHRFGNLHFGGGVFAGQSSLVGGGVFFGGLFPVGAANLGFQVSGGWLWAEVGMPVTVPLGDVVWLYTEPSVGFRAHVLRVPVGAGFRLGKHFTLAPEVAAVYSPQYAFDSTLAPRGTSPSWPYSLAFTGAVTAGFGF